MAHMLWEPARIDILRKLWVQGYTASAIAKTLADKGYRVSRNAVIGKVHRMGLERDGTKKPPKMPRAPYYTPSVFLPVPDGIKVIKKAHRLRKGGTMPEPDGSKRMLLTQTNEGNCKAIIGYQNGLLAEAICCGHPTPWVQNKNKLMRSPWCEYHRGLYIQKEPRK